MLETEQMGSEAVVLVGVGSATTGLTSRGLRRGVRRSDLQN